MKKFMKLIFLGVEDYKIFTYNYEKQLICINQKDLLSFQARNVL